MPNPLSDKEQLLVPDAAVAPITDFTRFPLYQLDSGIEGVILSFLSAREIARAVVFVSKWFAEAVTYMWRHFEIEYKERFLIEPLPLYFVAPRISPALSSSSASTYALHTDKNSPSRHAYLLTHGCHLDQSPFIRKPPASQEISVDVFLSDPSCIGLLHGNLLIGGDECVLEFGLERSRDPVFEHLLATVGDSAEVTALLETIRAANDRKVNTTGYTKKGGVRMPGLFVSKLTLIDDIVVVAGSSEHMGGRGLMYAYDAIDPEYRYSNQLHNEGACHEKQLTALGGWTDSYCGDVRSLSKNLTRATQRPLIPTVALSLALKMA